MEEPSWALSRTCDSLATDLLLLAQSEDLTFNPSVALYFIRATPPKERPFICIYHKLCRTTLAVTLYTNNAKLIMFYTHAGIMASD